MINMQTAAYADLGVTFDIADPSTWISADDAYARPDVVSYDGSNAKNKEVADILKNQYGWSDQQLADGGYEGYAPEPAPTVADTISNIVSNSPTAQIIDAVIPDAPATDYELFEDSYDAATADAAVNPTGTTQPTVYNDNDDDDNVEFANTVLNSDDITTFLPPTVGNNNDDNDSGPQGIVGNNDTGSNSIAQNIANSLTPNDGMEYVDGVLVNTQAMTQAMNNDNDSSNDDAGGDDDDCVIATHAVASGGFTPNMKREAVVWCMHKLHDRWWGEAVRRGYRYLGRKKIEQGKAREHYAEFRRYIDFASGKKRTLRGALTFTLRTAQFFAVGLIRKDA